ncbi:acyl-CoA dehydrogenase family protein [Microbacterium sp. NIBRBAC000506063]|nr:acyl-CoA dehydrogenase family protein [Microbacterium sp. NIBRBAC000506063]
MLGLCIPEEYGGQGAGVTEASILMEEIAAAGAVSTRARRSISSSSGSSR